MPGANTSTMMSGWKPSLPAVWIRISYSHRERPLDEILPWDFLDCGVSRSFLEREWQKAKNETISPNCKQACQGCGAARFGCGICVEPRD